MDEITVDLDVLGRADLMNYLRSESEERGACIVYATVRHVGRRAATVGYLGL